MTVGAKKLLRHLYAGPGEPVVGVVLAIQYMGGDQVQCSIWHAAEPTIVIPLDLLVVEATNGRCGRKGRNGLGSDATVVVVRTIEFDEHVLVAFVEADIAHEAARHSLAREVLQADDSSILHEDFLRCSNGRQATK